MSVSPSGRAPPGHWPKVDPGGQRKAWDLNPHPREGARISSAARQTISGYLPISVDPPGIEPGFPVCRTGVLPLDDEPSVLIVTLKSLTIPHFPLILGLESTLCIAQPPMRGTHGATHTPATFASGFSSATHSGPDGNRTHHTDFAGVSRLPWYMPARLSEVRPGIEPGLRPYHRRVLPKHLQTVVSVIPGRIELPISWVSSRRLRHWTTGSRQ